MVNTKRGRKKIYIFKHFAAPLGQTKCTFAKLKDNLGEKMFSQTIDDSVPPFHLPVCAVISVLRPWVSLSSKKTTKKVWNKNKSSSDDVEKPNTAGSWVLKHREGEEGCVHACVCVCFFLITNGTCVRVCLCVRFLLCGLVSVVKFPLCCLGHIHLREFAARPYEVKRLAAYAPLPDFNFWVCACRLCPQSYFVYLLVNHLHYNFFFFSPAARVMWNLREKRHLMHS